MRPITELQRWDRWNGDLGVAVFNAKNDYLPDGEVLLQTEVVMREFNSCFRDGVFTMAANKQFAEAAKTIKGGFLLPYKNVLLYDELEQRKSVVAISAWHAFSKHCPFTYDVVDAVQGALQANVPPGTKVCSFSLSSSPSSWASAPPPASVAHRFRGT